MVVEIRSREPLYIDGKVEIDYSFRNIFSYVILDKRLEQEIRAKLFMLSRFYGDMFTIVAEYNDANFKILVQIWANSVIFFINNSTDLDKLLDSVINFRFKIKKVITYV